MWLNSFSGDIDEFDSGSEQTREQAWEKSEKKWDWWKRMAWIQKTRKDEKKAKKDNDFLYKLIIDIIRDEKYDVIIPLIIELLKISVPSNLIIGVISLIFNEAVYIIRTYYKSWTDLIEIDYKKAKAFSLALTYIKTDEVVEFDDNNINLELKKRINEWIEDIINVISFDPSSIMTEKFLHLLDDKKNKEPILNYIAGVFIFFLHDLNIYISKEKAMLYSGFILKEVVDKLNSITFEIID